MIWKFIKNGSSHACVIFTLISAIYALIVILTNTSDEEILLDATRLILFFVASVIFAFANLLQKDTHISTVLAQIIHFVLYVFAFYTCFILPLGIEKQTEIVGVVSFSLGYGVVKGVSLLISSFTKRRKADTQEYTAQFKN